MNEAEAELDEDKKVENKVLQELVLTRRIGFHLNASLKSCKKQV